MKKSLLALAVLGAFAGATSAQSSVTIYGQIDQGVARSNGGTAGATGGVAPLAGSKAWQVRDGGAGSRLGFRGHEDLGGGLSAQFLIEHRLTPDTGVSTAGTFWNGGSYVQLTSKDVGSVYFGRWYSPAFFVSIKTDPFGYGGIAQVGALNFANYTNPSASGPGVRTTNTIGYKTPNFSGLTANVAVGLGEGTTVGRDVGLNVEYTGGPLYVGLAYDKVTGGTPTFTAATGSVDGNQLILVGAAYNFGVVRPMISYAKSETRTNSVLDSDTLSVGLTAPVGPGLLKAQYTQRNTDRAVLGGVPADVKLKKAGIGYDYYLSKRTKVYVEYANVKETGFTTNSAYALGVNHNF